MNVSLYQAAAALDGNIRWQQMIADNLSATSTPGFKKSDIAFSSVQAGVLGAATDPYSTRPSLLPSPHFSIDFRTGSLARTGTATDLAIEGPGFFTVELPNGQIAYTRDGTFRPNLEGTLLHKGGYPLQGEAGPINVDPRAMDNLSISEQGDISQGGGVLGRLRLVEFTEEQLQQLRPIGGGYYVPSDLNVQGAPAAESMVMQGFSESSNAQAPTEMSSLLIALRHFEANQRVIQMQDERMGKVIQELSTTT